MYILTYRLCMIFLLCKTLSCILKNGSKFSDEKISGENFREFPENVGKFPDGKIFGENFREIPGNSGKFRENSRRENFRGNFRGKFRENLFSRQPNL